MFIGKESSNRFELSRLVQDLLNFVVLGSLWLWGWGVGVTGWEMVGGYPHTCGMHTHTHAHTHTLMHGKHDNFMQMAACIGFLGNPWEFPMMSYMHACVRMMHAYACVSGYPLTTPTPSTHPHPQGDPCNQSKFNST